VPFVSGRADATPAQTDAQSFAFLEPAADGFRNYYSKNALRRPSDALIDKASMLNLSVPEMTALVGGLRALDANTGGSKAGVLTKTPGTLNNAFFRNLLDLSTTWKPAGKNQFNGTGANGAKWTATEVDLLFGSNAELRAVAEVYASEEQVFLKDFVAAWVKVMQADRFDLHR
jgi:catalase-peroxidase